MDYLFRLKDECMFIKQCDAFIDYLTKQNDNEKAARVGLIKLDHIYYKNDTLYEKTKIALEGKPEKLAELYFNSEPSEKVIDDIVKGVISTGSYKLKIKAILLQCYHHAIHNRYTEAKELI
jgi:hypothetical protein